MARRYMPQGFGLYKTPAGTTQAVAGSGGAAPRVSAPAFAGGRDDAVSLAGLGGLLGLMAVAGSDKKEEPYPVEPSLDPAPVFLQPLEPLSENLSRVSKKRWTPEDYAKQQEQADLQAAYAQMRAYNQTPDPEKRSSGWSSWLFGNKG